MFLRFRNSGYTFFRSLPIQFERTCYIIPLNDASHWLRNIFLWMNEHKHTNTQDISFASINACWSYVYARLSWRYIYAKPKPIHVNGQSEWLHSRNTQPTTTEQKKNKKIKNTLMKEEEVRARDIIHLEKCDMSLCMGNFHSIVFIVCDSFACDVT